MVRRKSHYLSDKFQSLCHEPDLPTSGSIYDRGKTTPPLLPLPLSHHDWAIIELQMTETHNRRAAHLVNNNLGVHHKRNRINRFVLLHILLSRTPSSSRGVLQWVAAKRAQMASKTYNFYYFFMVSSAGGSQNLCKSLTSINA